MPSTSLLFSLKTSQPIFTKAQVQIHIRVMAHTGDYMRECKKVGEIAVVELRCECDRHRLLTTKAMESSSSSSAGGSLKRRKLVSNTDDDQLVSRNSPEILVSPAMEDSGCVLLSRCSSTESSQFVKHELRSVDLKVELEAHANSGFENEISTLISCRFSRETTPSSDEMESSTATKQSTTSLRRKHPEAKMPAAAEIEEFFSAAEKYEQKRFVDKYNYDVVKDVPLEGRYQWVQLKP
ncbi:Cyclin-dependent kinase inhibitor 7 [Camellia lanceoleosa]|uniref:Cyclin-dependent kinase inhibitor 7 n=1 Tax=Camellia lanceoleosa TaxID=1840588 RepID=A0ACC0IWY0_9ERIC|nr:Cyclin-dependent kinase inhibitor 7 [Camellia lanceoleosa]